MNAAQAEEIAMEEFVERSEELTDDLLQWLFTASDGDAKLMLASLGAALGMMHIGCGLSEADIRKDMNILEEDTLAMRADYVRRKAN